MALTAGATLGPYRIVEPLGKGGMASVYKAYEAALDRYVALKVLPAEFLHEETFAERFRREAKVIASLEHPNIVPIHSFGIEEGAPWMAMRLVPGGTLAALLRSGRMLPARVIAILRGVAAALDYAHARGVVHRDVKPQNVLLDHDQRVYLADFGIARMLEGSSTLTSAGMISGTPHYMAPEQALGRTVDHRADIYALGIMAYQMLLGQVPFEADTPVAVLLKHAQEPMPLPSPTDMPEPMARALMKCVAKKPEDRWATATDFVRALEAAFDQASLEELPSIAMTGTIAPPFTPSGATGEQATVVSAEPAPAAQPARAAAGRPAMATRMALAAGVVLALGAAVAYFGLRRAGPGAPASSSPSRERGGPEQPATPAGDPGVATGDPSQPARLAIDFEHPLKTGTLRIWLDEQLVAEQKLDAQTAKNVVGLKLRKGSAGQVLEVLPGKHTVRVEVSWDDKTESETITGAFRPGSTKRLEARLGRIRKNLSLDWR